MNYKSSNDDLLNSDELKPTKQNLFNSLKQNQDELDFSRIVQQIHEYYHSETKSFLLPNNDKLLTFLKGSIFALENSKTFFNDEMTFAFFLFLLTESDYSSNALIIEMIFKCCYYLLSLDKFSFNNYSEQLLVFSLSNLQENQFAIFPCLSCIMTADDSILPYFVENQSAVHVVEAINSNSFLPEHFYFLVEYVQKCKFDVIQHQDLLNEMVAISIKFSHEYHGLYLLSVLVSHFNIDSIEIKEVVLFHLNSPETPFTELLLKILYHYALVHPEFFSMPDLFERFLHFFDFCGQKAKNNHLKIIYMLIPHYSKELCNFIPFLIDNSDSFSYEILIKICDIIILYLQEVSQQQEESQLLYSKTFDLFCKLLSSNENKIVLRILEILPAFKDINSELFYKLSGSSSLKEDIENLLDSPSDIVAGNSELTLYKLYIEYDEYEED